MNSGSSRRAIVVGGGIGGLAAAVGLHRGGWDVTVLERAAEFGDAAHTMTPHLGQGACQALEDAVVLGVLCADPVDVGAALAAYDRQRRPRTQSIARAAQLTGRFGQQLTNPLAVGLRNTALRLIPPRIALRSIARHTGWQPPQPTTAGGR